MPDPPLIYGLMAKILAELPSIGKTDENRQQGFSFRGIDAVLDNLNPLLAKHGVFFLPSVEEARYDARGLSNNRAMWVTWVQVRYRFYAPDGSSVEGVVVGEGADLGDKATSKAMTMAEKTMLTQAFAIATRELDPDAVTVEDSNVRQMHPVVPQEAVDRHPSVLPAGARLAEAARKAGFDDDTRKDALFALTGKTSSKELNAKQVREALEGFAKIERGELQFGYDEDGTPKVKSGVVPV